MIPEDTSTEREVLLKLLAARVVVDRAFRQELQTDPKAAAQRLQITLSDEDAEFIRNGIDWAVVNEHADAIGQALQHGLRAASW